MVIAPIAWQSKKICRVTKSLLVLETLSLSEVADAGFMIALVVQEINCLSSLPSVLHKTDNSLLMETLHTTKLIKDMCFWESNVSVNSSWVHPPGQPPGN